MNRSKFDMFFEEEVANNKLNKILMIDFHNLAYRCVFIALKEFSDKKNNYLLGNNNCLDTVSEKKWFEHDMFQYWKHLVTNNILHTIREKSPNKVIIATEGRNNWRKRLYSLYKANRKDSRDKSDINFDIFYGVIEKYINNLKEAFKNIYVLQVDGCEADDIIAILTKKFVEDKFNRIELISTDKDFVQLQKFKVFSQFDPIKKEYIKSINPSKDLELKILTGDKSDNILPILKGVGPKTAEKLLTGGMYKKTTFDQYLEQEEIKENYKRNRQLIDFEHIPNDVQDKILHAYNEYKIDSINVQDVWNWLHKEKLGKLIDNLQIFLNSIKSVK